jgi:hypothetical protein
MDNNAQRNAVPWDAISDGGADADGPELVVNVHEDGTAGGHVSALAFLRRMMGAAAAGTTSASSAGLLG